MKRETPIALLKRKKILNAKQYKNREKDDGEKTKKMKSKTKIAILTQIKEKKRMTSNMRK